RDWSSDVCSSDLKVRETIKPGNIGLTDLDLGIETMVCLADELIDEALLVQDNNTNQNAHEDTASQQKVQEDLSNPGQSLKMVLQSNGQKSNHFMSGTKNLLEL